MLDVRLKSQYQSLLMLDEMASSQLKTFEDALSRRIVDPSVSGPQASSHRNL